MKKLIGFAVIISIFFFTPSSVFCQWQEPGFNFQQYTRFDTNDEEDNLLRNRLEANLIYSLKENFNFVVSPFIELDHNFDRNEFERMEFGAEFGSNFAEHFYLGLGFQYAMLSYNWPAYSWYPETDDTSEMEPRFLFQYPLITIDEKELTGFILDEYTYDFRFGKGVRNEVCIGLKYPIWENLTGSLGWRHVDRIHDYDSDTIEIGGIFNF